LPAFHRGALRLRALPPDAPSGGGTRPGNESHVSLEVRLEPRLRLQAVLAVRIDRAVDEWGQTLTQPAAAVAGVGALAGGPNDEFFLTWDGESALPADLPGEVGPVPVRLRTAERPSRRLKELEGALALRVLAPEEPLLTLDGVREAGKSGKGRDGSALKVVEFHREAGGAVRLRVEVVPAGRDLFFAGAPARIILTAGGRWRGRGLPVPPPVAAGQLLLLDEHGRKIPLAGSPVPTVGGGGTAWDFTLEYQPGPEQGEPSRLVYTGRRSVTLEVPFLLEDVPLP
jgi:hypothetical protein